MFRRSRPDVYSVEYLVAHKHDSASALSRQKVLWLIVGVLLLVSIVMIGIVLGVVYARWDDHSLFEGKCSFRYLRLAQLLCIEADLRMPPGKII